MAQPQKSTNENLKLKQEIQYLSSLINNYAPVPRGPHHNYRQAYSSNKTELKQTVHKKWVSYSNKQRSYSTPTIRHHGVVANLPPCATKSSLIPDLGSSNRTVTVTSKSTRMVTSSKPARTVASSVTSQPARTRMVHASVEAYHVVDHDVQHNFPEYVPTRIVRSGHVSARVVKQPSIQSRSSSRTVLKPGEVLSKASVQKTSQAVCKPCDATSSTCTVSVNSIVSPMRSYKPLHSASKSNNIDLKTKRLDSISSNMVNIASQKPLSSSHQSTSSNRIVRSSALISSNTRKIKCVIAKQTQDGETAAVHGINGPRRTVIAPKMDQIYKPSATSHVMCSRNDVHVESNSPYNENSMVAKSRYKLTRTSPLKQESHSLPMTPPPFVTKRKLVRHHSAPGGVHTSPPILPTRNKYKLVKTPTKQIQRKSWIPLNSQWSFKSTSNFTPTPTVKLTSRYKLVKRAIQITHKKNAIAKLSPTARNKYKYPTRGAERRASRTRKKSSGAGKDQTEWTKKYSLKRDNTGADIVPKSLTINQLMGRTVNNVSHNKFKFILAGSKIKTKHRDGRYNYKPKLNRSTKWESSTWLSTYGSKVKKYTPGFAKSRFVLNRKMPTVSHSTVKRILSRATKVDRTRGVASRVLQKSIYTAHLARYKKVNKKKKPYCLYYNRFGRCNRGNQCTYVHDPNRVAICTRFLRGRCEIGNCPFSHKVSKEKMPVCQFFIRGVCNKDICLYLHSNVSKDAQICENFAQGYCELGDQCKEKHSLICPEYKTDGKCPRGRKCTLKHIKKQTTKRKIPTTSESTQRKLARREVVMDDCDDIDLPMRERHLPSYIALESSNIDTSRNMNDPAVIQTDPDDTLPSYIALDSTLDDTSQTEESVLLIHPRLSLGEL